MARARRGARTGQAQICVLTPAVERLRFEPHFVCAYTIGNDRITAIADEHYFDQLIYRLL